MPLKQCQRDNEKGWQWGQAGKCYLPSEEGSDEAAKAKAEAQGRAIEANTQEMTESVEIAEADLSKYLEVRQHPKAHFTSYQHKWLDKARGIIKSVGQWRTTGAEVVQKLLFRRDHGWTEETVKAWFAEHPEFYYPHEQLVFQEHQHALSEYPCSLELLPASGPHQQFNILRVRAIQGGWGKNTRTDAQDKRYQDYISYEFLESLIPLLEGSTVQTVKIKEPQDAPGDMPAKVKALLQELQQYGHPPEWVNLLYDKGLVEHAIGLLKNVRLEPLVQEADPNDASQWAVMAELHLAIGSSHADHARRLIELAWTQGLQQALGLSINYRAQVLRTTVQERPAFYFSRATHHVSTEFVINPGANGKITACLQDAGQGDETMDPKEKEQRAQAQETPEETTETPSVSEEEQPEAEASATQVEIASENSEESEVLAIPREADIGVGIVQDVRQGIAALADVVKGLAADITTIKAERTQEKTVSQLEALVTQSILDEETKEGLLTGIRKGEYQTYNEVRLAVKVAEQAVEKAVAAVQAQVASAPVFPGLSGNLSVSKNPQDVNVIRSHLAWDIPLTQAQEELRQKYGIEPFYAMSEEYKTLTGDHGLTWQYDPEYFRRTIGGAFTQSVILTTSYPEFLRNVINQRMRNVWGKIEMQWKKVVLPGDAFTDTRDEEDFIPGLAQEIPEVAEDGAYLDGTNGAVEKVTSVAKKHGRLFIVTEDDILNDRLRFVKRRADSHILAMYVTIAHKVWKLVLAVGTDDLVNSEDLGDASETGITGGVLYHADRKNYVNGSLLDADKIKQLRDLMLTQVDIAAASETPMPLTLKPGRVVCNTIHEGWVDGRLRGEYEPGRTDNFPNTMRMKALGEDDIIGLHPYYLHNKPDFLGLLPAPTVYDGIEVRYFRGQETPETLWENNQQPNNGFVFSNDQMRMRIKMRIRINRTQKKAFYALFEA